MVAKHYKGLGCSHSRWPAASLWPGSAPGQAGNFGCGRRAGKLLTDWPIYALAVVGPAGFILNEDAYQQGTLIAPARAIITACDPIISIALGRVWLNERLI